LFFIESKAFRFWEKKMLALRQAMNYTAASSGEFDPERLKLLREFMTFVQPKNRFIMTASRYFSMENT